MGGGAHRRVDSLVARGKSPSCPYESHKWHKEQTPLSLLPFFLIPNSMSPQISQLANGVVLTVQLQVLGQTFCLYNNSRLLLY